MDAFAWLLANPIIIWLFALALFIHWKRKSIEQHGIIFMLKNTHLADQIYSFSRRRLLKINILFDIGILASFLGMLYALKLLADGAYSIIFAQAGTANVSLLIPGVAIPGSPVTLPLLEGIISIAVLAIVHEFSHAIAASLQGLKPKAVALVLLAFIPAAGVELDEKKVAKLSRRSKLRIFAAGSFANFLTAVAFLFVGVALVFFFVTPVGMEVLRVETGTPAEGMLTNGTIITSINGVPAITKGEFMESSLGIFSSSKTISFSRVAATLKPGDKIVLGTTSGTVELTLAAFPDNPDRGRIGVVTVPKIDVPEDSALSWLLGLVHWIIVLNIGVGLINLLPAPLFDGGRMAEDMIAAVFPRGSERIVRGVQAFSATLLIVNLAPTFVKIFTAIASAIVGL